MGNFSQFFAILKQLPYADKAELVLSYSGGKTSSLREFSQTNPKGFEYMLNDLQTKLNPTPQPKVNGKDEIKKRRFRSLILRAMQDQGVAVRNGDWSEVNDFVTRFAGEGKRLSTMTLDELKKFNAQTHKLLDYYNAKKEMMLRQALLN